MRSIGVVSVGRSDFGIYRSLLRKLRASSRAKLQLIVAGMHLAPEFGLTAKAIEAEGFEISSRIEMLVSSDTPEGLAKSMGVGLIGFAQEFGRNRPDILVVLGDRFEMTTAAIAAVPFNIPIAHIHGGELTFGAIDDAFRHAVTKLSHLHFAATEEYGRRIVQMGEEPWRVTVCGAPALDEVRSLQRLSIEQLETRLGFALTPAPLLATFHPVTRELRQTEYHIGQFLAALDSFEGPILFTLPNADPGGRVIRKYIEAYVGERGSAHLVDNLGTENYFSLMAIAAAMVGNSSSGIVEAASFALPVVNVGSRQEGRVRAANVIDCECEKREIIRAMQKALELGFRRSLSGVQNPYQRHSAVDVILDRIVQIPLDYRLLSKRFYDLPRSEVTAI